MFLEDRAWKAVKSLQDLECMMQHATKPIELRIEAHMLNVPLLRSYKPRNESHLPEITPAWELSDTGALTYASLYTLLGKLGLQMGFDGEFTSLDGAWCLWAEK